MRPCREPLFTVVLPTHNRHAFLDEAVASVLAQTVSDFELVVVDDGSPEPTSVPDDRVRLVRLPTNQGPAVARNAGMAVAAGLYLAFLDDDDLYTPDRLELAQDGLRRAPVALCWTRFHDQPPGSNRRLEGDVGDVILLPGPLASVQPPSVGPAPSVRRPLGCRRGRRLVDSGGHLDPRYHRPECRLPRASARGTRHGNDVEARLQENLALIDAYADHLAHHRPSAAYRWKRIGLMALQLGDRRLARRALRGHGASILGRRQ